MRKITLNEDDMREPCEHNNLATCGHCNRSWCDTCNPTPSARCPFEYEHLNPDEFKSYREYEAEFLDPELQWGEESAKFQASLNEHEYDEDQEFAAFLANNDIKIDPNTPLAPHGGCNWSGCTTCFPPKDEEAEKAKARGKVIGINERHDTVTYIGCTPSVQESAQYVSVYFPKLGNMTITYETRPFSNGEKRPVVSVDFDVAKLDIIDKRGNDRRIK